MRNHRVHFAALRGLQNLAMSAGIAVVCSVLGLTGCVTTMIGEPITIQIPANLSEEEAQGLVTEFVQGDKRNTTARGSGSVSRKLRGKWRIEQWKPGSMVAAYSWRSHLLRVNIEFANRTALLEIGESANLRQSSQRIHKIAKALEMELAQDVRLGFAKAALRQQPQGSYASRRSGSKKPSFCGSMWGRDPGEQASCQRAQNRSYDRLLPVISQAKAAATTSESKKLKACYARSKTWAGADWEAIERCFYSPPASAW